MATAAGQSEAKRALFETQSWHMFDIHFEACYWPVSTSGLDLVGLGLGLGLGQEYGARRFRSPLLARTAWLDLMPFFFLLCQLPSNVTPEATGFLLKILGLESIDTA